MSVTHNIERRSFQMHRQLLWDVVTRQAGSPAKALLEAAMNSIDAGARNLTIAVNEKGYYVEDDGRGFSGREEIVSFFEVFGQPHADGDAKFGRYRMGRGQLMSQGPTEWRSGEFSMRVDIKANGLDYDLVKEADRFDGCRVSGQWYEPLRSSDLDGLLRDMVAMIEWCPIKTTINGRVISKDYAKQNWTLVTDDAWFMLRQTGSLKLYNMGAKVCDIPASRFGTGGVIVSKERLEVNFARNEVLSSCRVWKAIRKQLDATVGEGIRREAKKSQRLTEPERARLVALGRSGEMAFDEWKVLRVITDVVGHSWTLLSFAKAVDNKRVCVSKSGSVPDLVHKDGTAFVLSESTLNRFEVDTVEDLLAALIEVCEAEAGRRCNGWNEARHTQDQLRNAVPVEMSVIRKEVDGGHRIIPDRLLDKRDVIALEAARRMQFVIQFAVQGEAERRLGLSLDGFPTRRLVVGRSNSALGWTDGATYIALRLEHLQELRGGLTGFMRVAATLVHEVLHITAPDLESHDHDLEFMTFAHDMLSSEAMGRAVRNGLAAYASGMRRAGLSAGQKVNAALNSLTRVGDVIATAGGDIAQGHEDAAAKQAA